MSRKKIWQVVLCCLILVFCIIVGLVIGNYFVKKASEGKQQKVVSSEKSETDQRLESKKMRMILKLGITYVYREDYADINRGFWLLNYKFGSVSEVEDYMIFFFSESGDLKWVEKRISLLQQIVGPEVRIEYFRTDKYETFAVFWDDEHHVFIIDSRPYFTYDTPSGYDESFKQSE